MTEEKSNAVANEKADCNQKTSELNAIIKTLQNKNVAFENEAAEKVNDSFTIHANARFDRERLTYQKHIGELEDDNRGLSEAVSHLKIDLQEKEMLLEEHKLETEQLDNYKKSEITLNSEKQDMLQKILDYERKMNVYEDKIAILQGMAQQEEAHIKPHDIEFRSSASLENFRADFEKHDVKDLDSIRKSKEYSKEDNRKQIELLSQKHKEEIITLKEAINTKDKLINEMNSKLAQLQQSYEKAIKERDAMIRISNLLKEEVNTMRNRLTESKPNSPIKNIIRRYEANDHGQRSVSQEHLQLAGMVMDAHIKESKYFPNSKTLSVEQRKASEKTKTDITKKLIRNTPRNYGGKE